MSFAALLHQTGQILTRTEGPANDTYGQPVMVTSATTTVPCRLEQASDTGGASTEIIVGRDTVVTRWRLFLMPDAAIGALDQFVLVGEPDRTYEVVGEPHAAQGRGGTHHIEAILRTVVG